MKQSGVSKEEALELIDRLWEIDPANKQQE